MLTYSKLGKKGNLGNQLFQIASTISLGKKHNHQCFFPIWEFENYFLFDLPQAQVDAVKSKQLNEQFYHYHDWDIKEGNYDLYGYLQSEKYFDIPLVKNIFTFKPTFLNDLQNKNIYFNDPNKILISVRRGDFVHHPWFYQLSYKYYFTAIINNFPDWKNKTLIFTSDDINFCKKHFSFLPNSYFLDDLSAIEQLAFGTSCKDFIISNSTFSWWLAWLGEKEDSKIIVPIKNFRGNHSQVTNETDYFPKRWTKFNHHKYPIPANYFQLKFIGETNRIREYIQYATKKVKQKVLKKLNRLREDF